MNTIWTTMLCIAVLVIGVIFGKKIATKVAEPKNVALITYPIFFVEIIVGTILLGQGMLFWLFLSLSIACGLIAGIEMKNADRRMDIEAKRVILK